MMLEIQVLFWYKHCTFIVTQTFHGVIGDVIGISAGRTKAPSPVSTPTEDKQCTLEEPSHLHVSV